MKSLQVDGIAAYKAAAALGGSATTATIRALPMLAIATAVAECSLQLCSHAGNLIRNSCWSTVQD
jgi:hypothetical protein